MSNENYNDLQAFLVVAREGNFAGTEFREHRHGTVGPE